MAIAVWRKPELSAQPLAAELGKGGRLHYGDCRAPEAGSVGCGHAAALSLAAPRAAGWRACTPARAGGPSPNPLGGACGWLMLPAAAAIAWLPKAAAPVGVSVKDAWPAVDRVPRCGRTHGRPSCPCPPRVAYIGHGPPAAPCLEIASGAHCGWPRHGQLLPQLPAVDVCIAMTRTPTIPALV